MATVMSQSSTPQLCRDTRQYTRMAKVRQQKTTRVTTVPARCGASSAKSVMLAGGRGGTAGSTWTVAGEMGERRTTGEREGAARNGTIEGREKAEATRAYEPMKRTPQTYSIDVCSWFGAVGGCGLLLGSCLPIGPLKRERKRERASEKEAREASLAVGLSREPPGSPN